MNWLSQEEIKRRAEISDEEALNVSIQEWEKRCEVVKAGGCVDNRLNAACCGLCQRFAITPRNCKVACFLQIGARCCREYYDFFDSRTLLNAQAMLDRLYLERGKRYGAGHEIKKECKKEKPAELRHTDYGTKGHQNWIKIYDEIHWLDSISRDTSGFPDSYFVSSQARNLLDDLKRNAEDLDGFIVSHTYSDSNEKHKIQAKIAPTGIWMGTLGVCHTYPIKLAQEYHQNLGQVIAYAKRREAKKDC